LGSATVQLDDYESKKYAKELITARKFVGRSGGRLRNMLVKERATQAGCPFEICLFRLT